MHAYSIIVGNFKGFSLLTARQSFVLMSVIMVIIHILQLLLQNLYYHFFC